MLVARGVELVGGDLTAHVPGDLGRAEVRAVGVGSEHVAARTTPRIFGSDPDAGSEVAWPPGQVGGAGALDPPRLVSSR